MAAYDPSKGSDQYAKGSSIRCELKNGVPLCDVAAVMDRLQRFEFSLDSDQFIDALMSADLDKRLAEHIADKFWNEEHRDILSLYNDLDLDNKAALIRAALFRPAFDGADAISEVGTKIF